MYFVCIKKEHASDIISYLPNQTMEQVYLEDILETNPDKSLFVKRDDINLTNTPAKKALKPIRVGIVGKGGQGERIYSVYGHAITISAYGGGVGARTGLYKTANNDIRKLSINECKK